MSKVVKFGGSSLADAKQFRKVADIIHADPERKYVVPSAPGKRFKEDTKVTDMLYRCYDEVAVQGKDFTEAFAPIRERYNGITSRLLSAAITRQAAASTSTVSSSRTTSVSSSSTPHALSSSTTRAISTLTSPTHASARSLTRPRRR